MVCSNSNAPIYYSNLPILLMRITKVTTKTGDMGETGLANGERVSKNNPRIHAIGSLDKLNSFIGWTRVDAEKDIDNVLEAIQQDLFNIGAELAVPDIEMNLFNNSRLDWLDNQTDIYNQQLPPLDEFILPGGTELASRLHITRSECRETERYIINLSEQEFVSDLHKKYLNRLSDLLFNLSRIVALEKGVSEISWEYNK